MEQKVWLVGVGNMGVEYAKVLESQGVDFIAIGRGEKNVNAFMEKTGHQAIAGGLTSFICNNSYIPRFAIVATGVEILAQTTIELIKTGIKHILCEKPGGLNSKEIEEVANCAKEYNAQVFLAYNRRFYASVEKVQEIVLEDGGVTSFNFEFTEWSHIIEPLQKGARVKENWFLANSTHVVDLAFFLGGFPKEISCYNAGELAWHPSSSVFSGAGVSETGALFSYQANWEAPGRWGVEILTRKHRLYLRPMEKLAIQRIGSVQLEEVDIDDTLDKEFKPGLYKQMEAFLQKDFSKMATIGEQSVCMDIYNRIAFYK